MWMAHTERPTNLKIQVTHHVEVGVVVMHLTELGHFIGGSSPPLWVFCSQIIHVAMNGQHAGNVHVHISIPANVVEFLWIRCWLYAHPGDEWISLHWTAEELEAPSSTIFSLAFVSHFPGLEKIRKWQSRRRVEEKNIAGQKVCDILLCYSTFLLTSTLCTLPFFE